MKKLLWTAGLGAALSFSACAEAPTTDPLDLGYDGKTGLSISIAPLELATITDACYSFEIQNQALERVVARGRSVDPQAVGAGTGIAGQSGDGGPAGLSGTTANPLCADQFGDGQGAISYVAPCDASAGNENHTITLWVNSVCAGGTGFDAGTCTPLDGFVNPCGSAGCTVEALCTENADTPVSFNFTVMASAQQGFFDIAVNFDNVFCSAKLDNCYADQTPITLLHGATGREQTAVAAVACTAGPGETTTLNYENFVVDCAGTQYTLDLSDVTQEGNLADPINATLEDADGNTLTAAIYYGTEALPNAGGAAGSASKVYTNIAFLTPDGVSCKVEWFVVPSTSTTSPQPSDGANGVLTQVAGVRFDGSITNPDCTNDGLNDGGGVSTDYTDEQVSYTSQLTLGSTSFGDVVGAPVCQNPCDSAAISPAPYPDAATEYCFGLLGAGASCDLDTDCCVVN